MRSFRSSLARDITTSSSSISPTNRFTSAVSSTTPARDTTPDSGAAVKPDSAFTRARRFRCRFRSSCRFFSRSDRRRFAACARRRFSRHSAEHVLCLISADLCARNHFRHSVHRVRAVLAPRLIDRGCGIPSLSAERLPLDHFSQAPQGHSWRAVKQDRIREEGRR